MAQTINADNGVISGSTGLKFTADTTAILALQTASTTRVTVDASGNVGIGGVNSFDISPLGTGQYPQLATWSGSNNISQVWGYYGGANAFAPNAIFIKSRSSTIGTNTVVVSDDQLGNFVFRGADGTNYKNAATISAAVDAIVSAGIVPGRLTFSTADTAGTNTERMRIDSSGNIRAATGNFYSSANIAVAAAGTTSATATGLTADVNNVTTGQDATGLPGVRLPTPAAAGVRILVRNGAAASPGYTLKVWPHSGGSISGAGADIGIDVDATVVLEFIAFTTSTWYIPSAVLA
jgi:hypothetical protein